MKKYAILGVMVLLTLSFQNCGKVNQGDMGNDANGNPPAQYNKYSTADYSTLSLWDYARYQYLDLDLQSGQIVAFEEAGQVRGKTYQLKADVLAEAQQIMAGAEICEPVINSTDIENRVCTMNYRYPYAILVQQGDEARLGEITSGCDVPVDLCGDKAQKLHQWVTNIVDHLDTVVQ